MLRCCSWVLSTWCTLCLSWRSAHELRLAFPPRSAPKLPPLETSWLVRAMANVNLPLDGNWQQVADFYQVEIAPRGRHYEFYLHRLHAMPEVKEELHNEFHENTQTVRDRLQMYSGPWGNGIAKACLFLAAPMLCEDKSLNNEKTCGDKVESFLAWAWTNNSQHAQHASDCADALAKLCGLMLWSWRLPGADRYRKIIEIKTVEDLQFLADTRFVD